MPVIAVVILGALLSQGMLLADVAMSAPAIGEADSDGWIRSYGCLFVDDATGTRIQMKAGESRTAGRWEYKCEDKGSELQLLTRAATCQKEGAELKEGELFRRNHVISKCVNGLMRIMGCYTNEGKELGIGENLAANGLVYTCQRHADDNRVYYREEPCTGGGPCTVPPSSGGVVGPRQDEQFPAFRTLATERKENIQFVPPMMN